MDMYTKAMADVDVQVGRVLDAIPPDVRDNTVVFVADHGAYGGSHGMSGNAGSFYDEAVRVPLIIRDLRPGPHVSRRRFGLGRHQAQRCDRVSRNVSRIS